MKIGWKKLFGLAIFLSLCSGFLIYQSCSTTIGPEGKNTVTIQIPAHSAKIPTLQIRRIEGVVTPRTTLENMLSVLDVSPEQIQLLVRKVRPKYNLNRIKVGQRFMVETSLNGELRAFQYDISDEEYLSVILESGEYKVSHQIYQLDVVVQECYGAIGVSLWKTLIESGETAQLVYALTQILQWDVDFTSIQRGDFFKLIVEKKYRDGEFVKYGEIIGVEFHSGGHSFFGFRFQRPDTGKVEHYDEKGYMVKKAFLKVPFNFDPRITSRFSFSRYHPILKKRRPHLGVDFGAPHGTPVLAAGSGRIILAGRRGGYGKMVKILHPNGYSTSYAHLSRIDVRVGAKVGQGQRIGRVGSTGLSTGPHLDYRLQDRTGKYLNPLKVSALPSEGPISPNLMEEFVEIRDSLKKKLVSIPLVHPFFKRSHRVD